MKKLVAWAIVLTIVCFTMCGCGSKKEEKAVLQGDFIIHSGVKFGDTIEEVKEKETLELVFEDLREEYSEMEMVKSLEYKGELVGYPNSALYYYYGDYYYGDEGKIFRAFYWLFDDKEVMKKTKGKGIYENVCKMLKEKYGNNINEDEYKYLTISERKKALESRLESSEGVRYEFNGWLLEYNTYYIEIILYKQVLEEDTYETCAIEYLYHTKEEIQSKKEEIQNSDNKAIEDL